MPRSGGYGISTDRIDAYANALCVLIAFDTERYKSCVQTIIIHQQPALQPALATCFDKLGRAPHVDIRRIDKANRMQFVKSFRAFVSEMKSIVLFG